MIFSPHWKAEIARTQHVLLHENITVHLYLETAESNMNSLIPNIRMAAGGHKSDTLTYKFEEFMAKISIFRDFAIVATESELQLPH